MVLRFKTTRFGTVAAQSGDVLYFPLGLPGWEQLDRWMLLAEHDGGDVVWLQSVDREDVALAVVDPCRLVPHYSLHVSRWELGPVGAGTSGDLRTLVVISHDGHKLTLNLKAPLVVDLRRRLGCQIVSRADWPINYVPEQLRTVPLRRSA